MDSEYARLARTWWRGPKKAGLLVAGRVPLWLMDALGTAYNRERGLGVPMTAQRVAELSEAVVAELQKRGFDLVEAEWRLTGRVSLPEEPSGQ